MLVAFYNPVGLNKEADLNLLGLLVKDQRINEVLIYDRSMLLERNRNENILMINGGKLPIHKKVIDWFLDNLNTSIYNYTDLTYLAHPEITLEYYPEGFYKSISKNLPDDIFLPNLTFNMKYSQNSKVLLFNNKITAEILHAFPLVEYFKYPTGIVIEPTRKCNLKCIQCNFQTKSKANYTGKADLPVETAAKLAQEIRNWTIKPGIEFCWRGEGLLNKKIFEIIKMYSDINCTTVLITNAQLLNKKILIKLRESGLSSLIISIDGTTKQTYESIRKGASFEKLISAIDASIEVFSKDNLITTLSMVRMDSNRDEWDVIYDYYQNKCNTVRLQNEVVWYKEKFIAKNMFFYENRKYFCVYPWHTLGITVEGDVYACCTTTFQSQDEILGNINHNSLFNIWHGEKFNSLRSQMLAGEVKEPFQCVRCSRQPCSAGLVYQEMNGNIITRTLESVKYTTKVIPVLEPGNTRAKNVKLKALKYLASSWLPGPSYKVLAKAGKRLIGHKG